MLGWTGTRLPRRTLLSLCLAGGGIGLLAACQQQAATVPPTVVPTPLAAKPSAAPTEPAAIKPQASPAPASVPTTAGTVQSAPSAGSTPPVAAATSAAPGAAGTVPAATSTAAAEAGVLPGATKTGPGILLRNITPPLAESPLEQIDGLITPTRLHFVRNHFNGFPHIDADTWRLKVTGEISTPLDLSLADLQLLPTRTITMLLECGGNSRGRYVPPAEGTQWGNGAVSVAEYTGVAVAEVMQLAAMKESAVDLVFAGLDSGKVTRGLNRQKALDPDTMLVWAMNGEPLPVEHGYPVRLIVPGWIGVAHIKWLASIEVINKPFDGVYNTRQYVYLKQGQETGGTPMTTLPVKSALARPKPGSTVQPGRLMLSGFAWSGTEKIAKVEVSTDGGATYKEARLEEPNMRWVWVRWHYACTAAQGLLTIKTRATDAAGNVQPESVAWNRFGYGYNAIQSWQLGVGQPVSGAAASAGLSPASTAALTAVPTAAATVGAAGAVTGGGADQIARGAQVYGQACASCHGANGQGSAGFPRLVGGNTLSGFGHAKNLHDYVKRAMPQNAPGSLSDADYYAITAYLLAQNGVNSDGKVTVGPDTASGLSLK